MRQPVSIPTEAFEHSPWQRERLQGYLDNDPAALALSVWAHARTVAIFGLAPVAHALAELEGSAAADLFTAVYPDGARAAVLPLNDDVALGVAWLIAAACLGINGPGDARSYTEILAQAPDDAESTFDEVHVPDPAGTRWAITIRRVDKQSPAQHATELGDALLDWYEAQETTGPEAPPMRRQAAARLKQVALAEQRRRNAVAEAGA